ncbi:hypothetical protein OIO90_002474 [Microbotryomycetes sp. JL221]|nr:hypothetical protein OIO90_002474 [Microbotryomycetes sp. JL221]
MGPPPPPSTFPLPAKPVSAAPSHSAASSSSAAHYQQYNASRHQAYQPRPNTGYLSTSQPASPRLSSTSASASTPPASTSSAVPRSPAPRAPSTLSSALLDDPQAHKVLRKSLNKDNLTSNVELLDLGTGWKVHWRAWRGPALLTTTDASASSTATSSQQQTLKPDTALNYGSTVSRPTLQGSHSARNDKTDSSTTKKRKTTTFDDMLADLADDPPQANPQQHAQEPVASTSAHISLKDRIQSLHQVSFDQDPIELARRQVDELAAASATPLCLFSYVKVAPLRVQQQQNQAGPTDANDKGKGKATDEEEGARRILWVFSLRRGSADEPPDNTTRTALSTLDFPKLTSIGKGRFCHRELFPALYAENEDGTTNQKTGHERIRSPLDLKVSAFPSTCTISAELHSDLAMSIPASSTASTSAPAGRFRAPFEAFQAALLDNVLRIMLASEDQQRTAFKLGTKIVFFPKQPFAFPTSARATDKTTFEVSLHLSVLAEGVLVQSGVQYSNMRKLSSSTPPRPSTPILLAPYGIAAQVIRTFSPESCQVGAAQALAETWTQLLDGSGLKLEDQESWILCKIEMPASSVKATDEPLSGLSPLPHPQSEPTQEFCDVMWPASLCLIDGANVLPDTSPDSSPVRPRAIDLAGRIPASPAASSLLVTRPRSNTRSSVLSATSPRPNDESKLDPGQRIVPRRTGKDVFGGWSDGADPLTAQADRVAAMLEQLAEEREHKERLEKEAEAAMKAQPAPPPTPISGDMGRGAPLPAVPGAGGPISMRTPLSLGGSATEAPSPADGFMTADKNLLSSLGFGVSTSEVNVPGSSAPVQNVEQLYPSPDELGHGNFSTAPDVSMSLGAPAATAAVDPTFSDFDWGDDFGSGNVHQGVRGNLNQDFDDGMMMGLTDDDFSFFDEPAQIPVSMSTLPPSTTFDHSAGLQSAETSPKFVDHFSHLSGQPNFVAHGGSPSSPFAHSGSPLAHASPGLNAFNFSFDGGNNLMGLGNTPGSMQQLSVHDALNHKTPRTPFSPFVELTEEQQQQHEESPAFSLHSVSVAGTPLGQASSHRANFDAVHFGTSHTALDDRYDPRKGKFGLPSPEWGSDAKALPRARAGQILRPKSRSKSSTSSAYFSSVCDPRWTAALMLQRRKNASTRKVRSAFLIPGRTLKPSARLWVSPESISDTEEEESDDEGMDLDDSSLFGGHGADDDDSVSGTTAIGALNYTFGAALLLLHSHVNTLFPSSVPHEAPQLAAKPTSSALEAQLEPTLSLFTEQIMYNPDFRREADLPFVDSAADTVASSIVSFVNKMLRAFTSRCRSGSSALPNVVPSPARCKQPGVLLRNQKALVHVNPMATKFWRPMSFEPLSGSKDVTAFVVFEEGANSLPEIVSDWLGRSLRLGSHEPGAMKASNSFTSSKPGLCAVAKGTISDLKTKDEWRGFCSHIVESARHRKHSVLYILIPPDDAPQSTSSSIASAVAQVLKARQPNMSLVVYPISAAAVTGWRNSVGVEGSNGRPLEQLAFSVYDQLLVSVSSLSFPVPETFPAGSMMRPHALGPPIRQFQAPAITLSPSHEGKVDFGLNWPPASLEILHRHRLLHIAYTHVPGTVVGLHWLVMSCIDAKGEIWKTLPRRVQVKPEEPLEIVMAKWVWNMTRMLADTADVEWRVIISRVGLPSKLEIKAWEALLKEYLPMSKRPLHVTVVAVDVNAPLSVLRNSTATTTSPVVGFETVETEEGQVNSSTSSSHSSMMDTQQSTTLHVIPEEPVAFGPQHNLFAPASVYIIHLPSLASLAHLNKPEPFMSSSSRALDSPSNAISVCGIHVLASKGSPTSSLSITLRQHVQDICQSFVELATLGNVKWGASGRFAWHVEAALTVVRVIEQHNRQSLNT